MVDTNSFEEEIVADYKTTKTKVRSDITGSESWTAQPTTLPTLPTVTLPNLPEWEV